MYIEAVFREDCPVSIDVASSYLIELDGAAFGVGHHRLVYRVCVVNWDDVVESLEDLYESESVVYLVIGGPAQRVYNAGAARKARMLEFWRELRPTERPLGYLCIGLSGTKRSFEEILKEAPGWVNGKAATPGRNGYRCGLQNLKTAVAEWAREE